MPTINGCSPRPLDRLQAEFLRDGDRLTLRFRNSSGWVDTFLSSWFALWTVGCVGILIKIVQEPSLYLCLFAIPFWVSWLFVGGILAALFWGRDRFDLNPEGVTSIWSLLSITSTHPIPLKELLAFEVQEEQDSEGNFTCQIAAVSLGRGFTFGSHLPRPEQEWLVHELNQQLQELQRLAGICRPLKLPVNDDYRDCGAPSDSHWTFREEPGGVSFEERGKLSLLSVLGLLFINGFWNGMLSVFIIGGLMGLAPEEQVKVGAEWWELFWFLVPFELIGLVMFIGLLATLLEPFRVTRWSFSPGDITQRTTRLGLSPGWRSHYSCEGTLQMTVRPDLGTARRDVFGNLLTLQRGEGQYYGLQFVSDRNQDICAIRDLTLGEAQWMKGRLQAYGRVLHQGGADWT